MIVLSILIFGFSTGNITTSVSQSDRNRAEILLIETQKKIDNLIKNLNDQQLQYRRGDGKWSIKDNIEHLTKVEITVRSIINEVIKKQPASEMSSVADDNVWVKLAVPDEKFKAPEKLQPSTHNKRFSDIYSEFQKERLKTIGYIRSTKDSLRHKIKDHPVLGPIDMYQWILFIAAHTARHTVQIEDILRDSNFPGNNFYELTSTLTNEKRERIDYSQQHYIDEKLLAGISAVVSQKGKIVYEKNFGFQNIESKIKIADNTLFRIASMTKPMTVCGLLILYEEGKIKLDDPVYKFIPSFQNFRMIHEDGTVSELKNPITIRHLIMHTGGIAPYSKMQKNKIDFGKAKTLKEYVESLSTQNTLSQPGDAFIYGVSTAILGYVVEVVSQKPFDLFIKERIFTPLKMDNTFFFIPENDQSRLATMYLSKDGELLPQTEYGRSPFPNGAAGIACTAHDFLRFAHMLLNLGELDGNRILKQETIKLMTTDQLRRDLLVQVGNTVFENTGFGLGIAIINGNHNDWKPAPLIFKNLFNLPGGSYTWPGITNTYWWVDPTNEIVGVVLSQSADPGKTANFQEFYQTLYVKKEFK